MRTCGEVRMARNAGYEWETIVGFGPNLLIDDLGEVTRLGELCDRYGMDTISTSNTIGLAFYLFELGKLTKQDTGGLELTWGNFMAVRQLIRMIARREGIGELLSHGSRQFGAAFDAEDEAVQVNGLEVAYHDPRGVSGMALSYATSPRGACHNHDYYWMVELASSKRANWRHGILLTAMSREKAFLRKMWRRHQDWLPGNALVRCIFCAY